MYDTVDVVGPSRLVCKEGHALTGFQTKDFGHPSMEHYALRGDQLFRRSDEQDVVWLDGDGGLLCRRDAPYVPVIDFNGALGLYTHCERCLPVCYENDGWDRLDHRSPWVEYELVFSKGRVVDLIAVRLQSRDEVRAELEKSGLGVLPDDDRIVRRYLSKR